MSEKTYKSIMSGLESEPDVFVVRGLADRDLGLFLIFTGIVGGTPFYYLFCNLVLRIGRPDLFWGWLLSLAIVLGGLGVMRFSRKRVEVWKGERGNFIRLQDGFFGQKLTYTYGLEVKIRLALGDGGDFTNKAGLDVWEVTLLDGRCQFLLDSRAGRLQESRAMAEFLAKAIRCPLLCALDSSHNIEFDYRDVDLPYYLRARKYPALVGSHPQRPADCPIEVQDIDYGTGRRYRWGLLASGAPTETLTLFIIACVGGILPLWGSSGHRFSFLSQAWQSGDWSYFWGLAILFTIIFGIQFGYQSQIEVTPGRVNISKSIWGFPYVRKSILVEYLEGVVARKGSYGNSITLVSDALVYSLRVVSPQVVDYLVNDIQYFLVQNCGPGQTAAKGEKAAPKEAPSLAKKG